MTSSVVIYFMWSFMLFDGKNLEQMIFWEFSEAQEIKSLDVSSLWDYGY